MRRIMADTAEQITEQHERQARRSGLLLGMIAFGLSALWAIAGPIFSVPDENAHATKAIAQAHGQVVGYEVDGIRHLVVDLPPGFEYSPSIVCFAFTPEVPASCASALGDPGGTPWFNTWVGAYNPVYYALVGLPSLVLSGNDAVYGMRLVSALINSALIGLAGYAAMRHPRRSWAPLGALVVTSPMIVYFSGAVNPQGFEIAGAFLLWWAGLRLAEQWRTTGQPHGSMILWASVVLGALAVSNARATGPLWTAVILLLVVVVVGWRSSWNALLTWRSAPWLAAIAGPASFSVGWTLWGGSLSNQAEVNDAPLVNASPVAGAWYMMRQTPNWVQQASGFFGWLDTPMPAALYVVFYAVIAIPVITAFATLSRDALLRLGAVVLVAFALPVALQAGSVSQTGIIWQGRYGIFLYLGVVVVASWQLSRHNAEQPGRVARRLVPLSAAALALYGTAAFVVVLWRYSVGTDVPITTMLRETSWHPPLHWALLAGLYALLTLATVVWALLAQRPQKDLDIDDAQPAVIGSAPS